MMIPLTGAKVRVKVGPRTGQVGIVEVVFDASDAIRDAEGMVREFIKRCRARFGEDWSRHWYEALVSFQDGSERMDGTSLEIIELSMVRPDRYSTT